MAADPAMSDGLDPITMAEKRLMIEETSIRVAKLLRPYSCQDKQLIESRVKRLLRIQLAPTPTAGVQAGGGDGEGTAPATDARSTLTT